MSIVVIKVLGVLARLQGCLRFRHKNTATAGSISPEIHQWGVPRYISPEIEQQRIDSHVATARMISWEELDS